MCASMAGMQSPTAEIRRGKRRKKKEEETTGQNIMACPIKYRAAIKNCTLYTLLTATDQKPQKSFKKALLTILTSPECQC